MTMTSAQCRAARALLKWSQTELAEAAKVARATLAEFEADRRTPYPRTLDDIQQALEAAGIVFIPVNGGGSGVRWKQEPTS